MSSPIIKKTNEIFNLCNYTSFELDKRKIFMYSGNHAHGGLGLFRYHDTLTYETPQDAKNAMDEFSRALEQCMSKSNKQTS